MDKVIAAINSIKKGVQFNMTVRNETDTYFPVKQSDGSWDLKCTEDKDGVEAWYGVSCVNLRELKSILKEDYKNGLITDVCAL